MNALSFITTAADQCVKCGLCLPHCPTYRLLRNEADSPRGRISLMQGLAQGQLTADKPLLQHLDRCLGCQACEKVCPSGVQYGQLLDRSRDWIESSNPRPWPARILRGIALYLTSHTNAWSFIWRLLRLYQRSGIQALCQYSGLLRLLGLHRLDGQLPTIKAPQRLAERYPTTGRLHGKIGLLIGCMENVVSATLLRDTIRLLNHAGYEVVIPANQGCCGALHQHNGALATARTLAQININAFEQAHVDTVVYLSSGCGSTLDNYTAHSNASTASSHKKPIQFIEAIQFLDDATVLQTLQFRPLPQAIAWLSPCSQRHVTGGQRANRKLLGFIPDINIIELDNDCCGAAGSYMITQPDLAEKLRDDVLAPFEDNDIRTLVTANVGCTLHLANGLRQRGLNVEVIHPLTLLARQLDAD